MRLLPVPHDMNLSGGKALHAEEGTVEALLLWGHIPTIRARGGEVPEQWERAQFMCDLEVHDDGVLVLHKERNFRTEAPCRTWFRFVAWCLARVSPQDFAACHDNPWVLT